MMGVAIFVIIVLVIAIWVIVELKRTRHKFFAIFLYKQFPPQRIPPPIRVLKPLHPLGILFEPEYEQEVVYLFSVFHRELGFPYIIKIRNEFPDALVMDKKRNVKKIEFEKPVLSKDNPNKDENIEPK